MPTSTPAATSGRGRLRRLLAIGVALAGVIAVGGCDLAGAANTPPEPKRGGTLYINVGNGIDSLDPQRTYSATGANILRLVTRTLTTYRSVPGAASEIVPDLATDTGRPSENNTVWKFTLKPNVKWQGGELVTCEQVKYGIERRYATTYAFTNTDGLRVFPFTQGPSYALPGDRGGYLVDNDKPYLGPYLANDNDGNGLESIVCLDERNIEFHLSRPVGDFGYALAMAVFAPVPPERDTKEHYEDAPYSNGPYKIVSRDDKQMVLERNNFWTATNDQVRKAYPDKIVFTFVADDGGVLTNEIIEDQGTARNTISLDSNVAPNFLQQVINDADLSARTVTGSVGDVRYLAINTRRISNLACRQALIYAFDKRKWRAVAGGSALGDYATTFIPPGVHGYKNFDLFQATANPEGQPDKAAAIMDQQQRAGHPCPAAVHVAYRDSALYKRLISTVVEAYQLAGIQAIPEPVDRDVYYTTGIGDPANHFDLMVAGWIPDWASGSATLPPVFDGAVIPPLSAAGHAAGNVNFSLLDDPKINDGLHAAQAEADPDRAAARWGELDQEIQALAVDIPILNEKAVLLTGSNVLGGYIHPAFGEPDTCALGLANP